MPCRERIDRLVALRAPLSPAQKYAFRRGFILSALSSRLQAYRVALKSLLSEAWRWDRSYFESLPQSGEQWEDFQRQIDRHLSPVVNRMDRYRQKEYEDAIEKLQLAGYPRWEDFQTWCEMRFEPIQDTAEIEGISTSRACSRLDLVEPAETLYQKWEQLIANCLKELEKTLPPSLWYIDSQSIIAA